MSVRSFSYRVKGYSKGQLFRIVVYKLLYKLLLKCEKTKIRLLGSRWHVLSPKATPALHFEHFFDNCDRQIDNVIETANQIISGKISIFHQIIDFDVRKDWLKDPVSQKEWNAQAFAYEASVSKEGYGDVKFVLEINKLGFLVPVARAYYLTHDEKYVQYVEAALDGWMRAIKPEQSVVNKIIMDLGFRIVNLIQILLLCKENEQFQQQIAPCINGVIFDLVKTIERFHTAKWFKTGNGANHVTGEMVGLILGQLWLQNNGLANYDKKYKKEYAYLVEVLNRTIAPSGAYLEQSGNYSRLVAEFLVLFDLLKGSMGHHNYCKEYYDGHYKERLLQYLRDITYNDYVPNFGDNDDARALTAFRGEHEQVEYFLMDIEPSYHPNAYIEDGSQWVFNSRDEYDVHMFARVGKFAYFREGAAIHAHNDLLALLLGFKGQPVFVDKGMLFYNSGAELRKTYSQIAAHNTIFIEGFEMNKLGAGICYQYPQGEFVKRDVRNTVVFSGVLKYGSIEQKRTIAYSDGKIEIEDYLMLDDATKVKGSIHYLLDQQIKAVMKGEDVVLALLDGSIMRVTIQGIESLELCPSDYSPAYGQNVKTTLIKGDFTMNKETRIKTIIIT